MLPDVTLITGTPAHRGWELKLPVIQLFQTSRADCPWQKEPQTDQSVWCHQSMSGLPRHLLVPFNFESKWESLDVWNRREARQGKRKARWDEIVLPQSSSREKANTMSVHSPAGFLTDRTCGDALENENLTKVTLHTKMLHSPRSPRLFLSGHGSGLGLRRIPYPPIKPCLSMISIPMNKYGKISKMASPLWEKNDADFMHTQTPHPLFSK